MNDLIDKKIYYSELYNLYSSLLSLSSKERIYSFYFEDLSLSEIAEKEKVSRNAIFLSIKNGEKELNLYENKLKLYSKKKHIIELLDKLEINNSNLEIINKIKGEL